MDTITITQLKVFAHHGVLAHETADGQDFYVNARLYLDTSEAGISDELDQTVDYGQVCCCITEYMQGHTFRLIEAAAEQTAAEVLVSFPLLRGVELEICKPHAPIPYPFGNVSVSICRMWHTVYLSVGSNMGEREKYIQGSMEALSRHRLCRVKRVSRLISTKPYGGVAKEDFLNGAMELETLLAPRQLLGLLHELEQQAGRERLIRWGSRTLDLDILFYDGEVIDEPELQIPHIDMENRAFVLEPLCELAPYLRHPITKRTVKDMLEALQNR